MPTPAEPTPPSRRKSDYHRRFAVFRRRTFWVLSIIVGLLLLLRLSLIFIFPAVIEHVLAYYNLTAGYNQIKLDVLGGDAEIWGLKVRPIKGGPDVMDIEFCHGNISILDLFRGRLFIRRLVADGADLNVVREVNGDCPLLDAFISHSSRPASVQINSSENKTTISLAAPLRIAGFRVEHLRLHVVDHSVRPAVHLAVTMNLRVSHLGRKHGASAFSLDLWSPALVDVLHINGSLTTGKNALRVTAQLLMVGLRLPPTAGYFEAMGIKPGDAALSLRANSTLALRVVKHKGTGAQAIDGNFTLNDLRLKSGGIQALRIDQLKARGQLAGNLADVKLLSFTGVRLHAGRGKNGLFHFAGLELLRHIAKAAKAMTAGTAPVATHGKAIDVKIKTKSRVKVVHIKNADSYKLSIDRVEVHRINAVFNDAYIVPHAHLRLALKTLVAVSAGGLPGKPGHDLTITGNGALPGIAGAIDISGSMLSQAHTRTLKLHLAAANITAMALAPYLAAAGLKSELQSAKLNVDLTGAMTTLANGTVAANVQLDHLTFVDGLKTLCDFKRIDAMNMRVDSITHRWEIGSVHIAGPAFNFVRESSGQFSVLGMQILGAPVHKLSFVPGKIGHPSVLKVAPVKAAALAQDRRAGAVPLRLQLDHFQWRGIRIGFDDQFVKPATRIAISHAGIILNHFIFDLSGHATERKPGTVKAWLQAPGIIGALAIQGTLNPAKGGFKTTLHAVGTDMNLQHLRAYLEPLRIMPLLHQGTLGGDLVASLALQHGHLSGGVRLSRIALRQGRQLLAGVTELAVSKMVARHGDFSARSLQIIKPFLHITRLANGNLSACGIELLPPSPLELKPLTSVSKARTASIPGTMMRADIGSIALSDALVRWTDLAAYKPVRVRLQVNAQAIHVLLGHRHPPWGTLHVELAARGMADAINIHGSFAFPAHALHTRLKLQATGLHGAIINMYLPQGFSLAPKGENVATSLRLNMVEHADGSMSGGAGIMNFNVVQTTGKTVSRNLLLMPHAFIDFKNLNLPQHIVALNAIDVDVKAIRVAHNRGVWNICGLRMGQQLNLKPAVAHVAATSSAFSIAPAQLPLISIADVHFHAGDIMLTGVLPNQTSLTLSRVDLKNATPITCLGVAPSRQPAIDLTLTGTVNKIAKHFAATVAVKPFANHPRGTTHVVIQGIQGAGLAEISTMIGRHFASEALKQGEFSADGSVELTMARRSPVAFNFGRQFHASIHATHLAFRATPQGPIVAGVTAIDAENIDVQPAHRLITIAQVNIHNPIIRITHNASGWKVLGMPLRSNTSKVPLHGEAAASHVRASMPGRVHLPSGASQPTAIIIRRLVISGLDAKFIDRTTLPQMCVPLTSLEAQVFNLGTAPWMQHIPVRFNLIAYAGAVRTPQSRTERAASPRTTLASTPHVSTIATSTRPSAAPAAKSIFSQIAVNGQIYLYPTLQGWSKISVNGLYLAELKPLAREYGITLSGGTFDSTNDIRLKTNDRAIIHAKLVFSNMDVSEPPHGPLEKIFNLAIPLNVAIAAIESPDGSITIPLTLPVNANGISASDLRGQVLGGLAQAIATGIASSPLKLANGLVGLFEPGKVQPVKEPAVTLQFSPGSTSMTLADWRKLQGLGRLLRRHDALQVVVRQEISTADVVMAASRANPTPSQCVEMIGALQARMTRLLAQRRKQLGTLRGEFAIHLSAAAITRGTARLSRLDAKIARAQLAINDLADMLAPGAGREAARRTRGAVIKIARQRLMKIKASLQAAGIYDPQRRIHMVFPQYIPITSPLGGSAVMTLVRVKE